MFLNSKELKEMTGYSNRPSQAKWLAENGYKFDVRADGRPNVLIDQIRERQCKNTKSKPGPDFSSINGTG